ncbi:DHHA1 domain-containing protein [Breoghania sp.]|uniref:DHHA1 domain-containing protein n=1 Tax=Breoghania sp. TaxID=2065378 RepID=UPI002AABFB7B|nr:DHHA1 domain-containing protein [Breoghania sp.]
MTGTPYKPDILIYHDNCDDGFAAAWIGHMKWGDTVTYMPSNYGRPLPDFDPAGKDILVADFSLTLDQCHELVISGARILMLDHHKTARDNLADLQSTFRPTIFSVNEEFDALREAAPAPEFWRNRVMVEFDMGRSGARMMWDFIAPFATAPELVLAVEDRDLWRFEREDTKLVSLYLRSLDRDFTQWTKASGLYTSHREQFLREAKAIKRFYDRRIAAICKSAAPQEFCGYQGVPVTYACPYDFASDTCHTLLEMYPKAPFAAVGIQNAEGVTYSLRSTDDRVDVSEVAKANGGGGHRNAAGFRKGREIVVTHHFERV